MKYSTVTSHREINLDHQQTCGNCGKTYTVIQRAYGRVSASDLGGLSAKQRIRLVTASEDESARRMLLDEAKFLPYHRCTECGLYDSESMSKMKSEGYRRYRGHARKTLAGSSVLFLVSLAGLGSCIAGRRDIGSYIIVIALLLISVSAAVIGKPVSKKTWETLAEKANSPEIASKWLAKWNDEQARDARQGIRSENARARESAWKRIKGIQHYLDPKWPQAY